MLMFHYYQSCFRRGVNCLLITTLLLATISPVAVPVAAASLAAKAQDQATECPTLHCTGAAPTPRVIADSATRSIRTRGSNSQLAIPQNIVLADMDADGISDLLQSAGSNLFVRKMDFEQTKILNLDVRLRIKRVLTGDFHGDHYDQTCIILEDNSLVCYGISPGHRELWWWFTQGTIADDSEDTIVGDFDGDGRDDVLVYPRTGGPFRMYSIKGDFLFEPSPAFDQGNLSGVNTSGMQVRAGDFDGNGRDDVLVVNPQGQLLDYSSVNDGTHNTFWSAFTTNAGFVGPDDQVTVAHIDDNTTDDVVLRNRKTAETRFFRMEWANGVLPAITNVATGQMSGTANSFLLWGSMHGALDEPGATNRDDAIVYEVDNVSYVRSDARWDGKALTYWWAYTQVAPKNQFALQIERLHVNYQDDGIFGGGDEPYLIVIGFRSRFKTPNSTFTYWSGELQDKWAGGVVAGDERDVPTPMGLFQLPGISLTTMDDAASGRQFPELVGALVLAMESDGTPFGDIRDKINSDLRPAMEAELRRLIENGELDLAHLEGDALQQAIKTVETAAAVKFWEGLGLWLTSFGDPDDKIDKHLFAYLTAGPDLQGFVPSKQEPGLTFGVLQDQRFEINNNPIIFHENASDGSEYQVTVSVKSDATTWVHQDPASCKPNNTTISKSFLPFVLGTGGQGATPATKALSVLQYNVQFLTPWEGKPIIAEHWPNTTERATAIGKAIACYDVVALNETVNPQRRQEILDAMNAEAPNCGKPDLIPGPAYFAVADGPDVDGALLKNSSEAVDKLFANPGKPIMGDEVMIISRLPIIQTDAHIYGYSANEDRLAAKGVLHVRLQGAEPFPINPIDVFATHLQAGDANVRACQVNELADYVRTHTTPQNTVLLMGDFNIDGAASAQSDINSEYTYLNNTLTLLGNGHTLQDAGKALTSGTNQSNDPNEHRKHRIDYIFTSGPSVLVNQQDVQILEFPDPTGQKPSLSDHAAVEAVVKAK